MAAGTGDVLMARLRESLEQARSAADPAAEAATELAETVADFFARKTKNEVTPPSTTATTPSRLKMPQFMPLAIAESD